MKHKGINFCHNPWNALYSLKLCDNNEYITIASFQKHINTQTTPHAFKKMTRNYVVKKNGRNCISVEDLCIIIKDNNLFQDKVHRQIVCDDLLGLKKTKQNWCSWILSWGINTQK